MAQLYRVTIVGLAMLLPFAAALILSYVLQPSRRFDSHLFHEIAIGIAVGLSGFIAYVAHKSQMREQAGFLGYLTLAYLAFGVLYAPHGALTPVAHHNLGLFVIFGPISRLAMAGYVFAAYEASRLGRQPARLSKHLLVWLAVVAFAGWAGLTGRIKIPMVKALELAALATALAAIYRILRRGDYSSLGRAHLIGQALFAQSSASFLIAKPWDATWWLAHGISAAGFLWLGVGIVRRFELSGSLEKVYDEVAAKQVEDEVGRLRKDVEELLAVSLDFESTLAQVTQLAINNLAEFCALDRFDDEGRLARLVTANATMGPGPSLTAEEIEKALMSSNSPTGELLRLGDEWTCLVSPLQARGRTIGAITLASRGARQYRKSDLQRVQDFARRAALAVDNARLYGEAHAAVQLRDEFLSIAAHELRTPLTALQLQLQSLLREEEGIAADDKDWKQKIESAARHTRRIARLVENLLDTTRLARGRLHLQVERMDLAATAAEALERMRPEARQAGCELLLEAQAAVGRWDPLRLDQVIGNLVSNSLKYAPGTPIHVQVEPMAQGARLTVRDRGIGIEPQAAARIFDRFERAVSVRNYGGLGLGLFITRQIVEAHGGKIHVTSRPGEGSIFTVELPSEPTVPRTA